MQIQVRSDGEGVGNIALRKLFWHVVTPDQPERPIQIAGQTHWHTRYAACVAYEAWLAEKAEAERLRAEKATGTSP